MKATTIIALLILAISLPAYSTTVNDEIAHLLEFVRNSKVVFIRNGSEHTPAQAVDHMEKKRQHFEDQIETTEDFIRLSATRSLLSNEPYLIRFPDGTTEECAKWLQVELDRFRKARSRIGQ